MVAAGLRDVLGEGSPALASATVTRDVHTVIGLAACGVGVGLGPSRMLAAPRPGTWFCEVTPRTPLPDLVLSFSPEDRSPSWTPSSTSSAPTARSWAPLWTGSSAPGARRRGRFGP